MDKDYNNEADKIEYCRECDKHHHVFSCPKVEVKPIKITKELIDKVIKELKNE